MNHNYADFLHALANFFATTAVYQVDSKQNVVTWAGKMATLTGITYYDAVGKSCLHSLAFAEDASAIERLLSLSVQGKTHQCRLLQYVLRGSRGEFAGGIGILQENAIANVAPPRDALNFHGILSRAPSMRPVFQLIENAATTEVTVLVRGESGSGKELVARAIHNISPRQHRPFLAINCAALSSNLLESELFGHAKGAFSGAIKDHNGLFKRADGGTLFLDEVAEMPLELQAKLLRVLEDKEFFPVGGEKAFTADVRIVAATNKSLRAAVRHGNFREDLMYRLRIVPIFIPPLRDRREDIQLLLWHFINRHNQHNPRQISSIAPAAMRVLMDYHWPGNIRELQNVLEYAFVVIQGKTLTTADLPPEFAETKQPQNKPLPPAQEADLIRYALQDSGGKIAPALKICAMSRATFWRKRKLYGI